MKKFLSVLLVLCMALSLTFAFADEVYEPVTIVNGDRTITFTEMPTGILSCNTCATENIIMLGLADKLVGRNVPSNPADVPLEELQPAVENVPTFEKSHENAVASGADFVIGQVSVFRESTWGSYEMFESKGINCYTISGTIVLDETVENIYEDVRALGAIFKVEDRAEELIADIQARIDAVQETVSVVAEEDKPVVFVMDSNNGNEIYTTSSGLQSNLIELAGGINATKGMADSRWFTTSVEVIVETNPDIIIFNDYGSQTIEEKIDFIESNPALQDVPAVANKNYVIIPLVQVMQDVRAAAACETFAQAFYPDLFA
ncbi:MAG: ABC transporter substrate-binding protein [Clostridia bacterium]|nr:ABC transporter substrate-binding protein [Clostridia bacterium]